MTEAHPPEPRDTGSGVHQHATAPSLFVLACPHYPTTYQHMFSPCIIFSVYPLIICGAAACMGRGKLQLPVVKAVQEHFCQIIHHLPVRLLQATKTIHHKVRHGLCRRMGEYSGQESTGPYLGNGGFLKGWGTKLVPSKRWQLQLQQIAFKKLEKKAISLL